MSWSRRFDDPISRPDGLVLRTLGDAGEYIQALPRAQNRRPEWQIAAEMLLAAVEGTSPLMFAEIAMRKAVNAGKSAPGKRRTTDASSTLSHSVSAADLKRAGPLDLDQAYRASDSPRGNAA
jgi:hypothetical protein